MDVISEDCLRPLEDTSRFTRNSCSGKTKHPEKPNFMKKFLSKTKLNNPPDGDGIPTSTIISENIDENTEEISVQISKLKNQKIVEMQLPSQPESKLKSNPSDVLSKTKHQEKPTFMKKFLSKVKLDNPLDENGAPSLTVISETIDKNIADNSMQLSNLKNQKTVEMQLPSQPDYKSKSNYSETLGNTKHPEKQPFMKKFLSKTKFSNLLDEDDAPTKAIISETIGENIDENSMLLSKLKNQKKVKMQLPSSKESTSKSNSSKPLFGPDAQMKNIQKPVERFCMKIMNQYVNTFFKVSVRMGVLEHVGGVGDSARYKMLKNDEKNLKKLQNALKTTTKKAIAGKKQ